jgi:dUTPase
MSQQVPNTPQREPSKHDSLVQTPGHVTVKFAGRFGDNACPKSVIPAQDLATWSNDELAISQTKVRPVLLVQRVHHQAKLPRYSTEEVAGLDLFATAHLDLPPQKWSKMGTGIRIVCPPGTYGRVAPRSSLAFENGISMLMGIIDNNYRNEINVPIYNPGTMNICI